MIDKDGFRANVGIIISNHNGRVFWGKRVRQKAWQFPQGGVHEGETAKQAMLRELYEEVGLLPEDVEILGVTQKWLRYYLPKRYIRQGANPKVIGQKQKWFLLRLKSEDKAIQLDKSKSPEFDDWRWVSYWHPLQEVISFKRQVYRKALRELATLIFPDSYDS